MSDIALSVTAEALSEIEDALQEPLFFDIPVGSTINDILITNFHNGNRTWNLKTRVMDNMRYCFHRFRKLRTNGRDFSQYEGRIIFTWLFNRNDLKRFVMPLVNTIGAEKTIILGQVASSAAEFPFDAVFGSWDEFPEIDLRIWRREFDYCSAKWHLNLKKVLNRHGISNCVSTFIMDNLQLNTQLIMSSSRFLEQVRPKAIITEYDRNVCASCLILAAKGKNIPTVTMIHGALEPYPAYGFAPLLADVACCWGERHKAQMMGYGINPERLIITGCQRLSRTLEAGRAYSRAKLDISADIPMVLLATNPISPEDKMVVASIYCAGVSEIENIFAAVRLHPAEHLEEYDDLISRYPKIKFLLNSACTQDEVLAATDFVVNQESGFGNDALVKGKLVIEMDVLATPLKNGRELIDVAGCPCVKNAIELKDVINRLFAEVELQNDLHRKAEVYVRSYCHAFGQEAAKNIVYEIDRMIGERK